MRENHLKVETQNHFKNERDYDFKGDTENDFNYERVTDFPRRLLEPNRSLTLSSWNQTNNRHLTLATHRINELLTAS